MATLYVSPAGADSASGTASAPFRSLNRAETAAEPGDVILASPGPYAPLWIDRNGEPRAKITIRSSVKWGAKIAASDYGIFIGGDYITVDGFEVSGSSKSGISGADVHHVGVINCRVHDNDACGVIFQRSEFLNISGNTIYNNTATGASSGISIHMPKCVSGDMTTIGPRVTIQENSVHSCLFTLNDNPTDSNGIMLDEWEVYGYRFDALIQTNLVQLCGGPGIRTHDTRATVTVRNNTVWKNNRQRMGAAWRGEILNETADMICVNNIAIADPVTNPTAVAIAIMAGDNRVCNNLLGPFGASTKFDPAASVAFTDNLQGPDPLFVGPTTNYRLKAGSPAINAGTTRYGYPYTDFYGVTRSRPDIGAAEFV